MSLRHLILIFAALATVVVLAACGPSEQPGGDGGSNAQNQGQQEPPDEQVAPQQGAQEDSDDAQAAVEPPSDDMMKLTVPKMEQIEDDEIPTGLGTDETLFHDYAGSQPIVHLEAKSARERQQAAIKTPKAEGIYKGRERSAADCKRLANIQPSLPLDIAAGSAVALYGRQVVAVAYATLYGDSPNRAGRDGALEERTDFCDC